ncbi:hypothetical protein B7C51_23390 [Paenibacillus larvae subsp. pulvifaciens]|uniref:Uncharacterized protein n=1 Tax=Paenibacillus larvae subsp. pulvifaciens TaxID=1477 RepID=A0A1V0UY69_9BACL|nr:hypothetical protein B7C51_23390 [Paenibacillus larvae subsp. pulvifaciens]MBH0341423.1 hypothetical protein [Paenibacillus larvae]
MGIRQPINRISMYANRFSIGAVRNWPPSKRKRGRFLLWLTAFPIKASYSSWLVQTKSFECYSVLLLYILKKSESVFPH